MQVPQDVVSPRGWGPRGEGGARERTGRWAARLCCLSPNLELLGFVVLQALHYRGKSLFVVPLGSDGHGSQNLIQAEGVEDRDQAQTQKSTLLSLP